MFNRSGSVSISPQWIKRIGIEPSKFLGVFVLGKSPITLFSDGASGLRLMTRKWHSRAGRRDDQPGEQKQRWSKILN